MSCLCGVSETPFLDLPAQRLFTLLTGQRHLLRDNFIRKETALGIQYEVWEIMSYKSKQFHKINFDRIHPSRKCALLCSTEN